MAAQYQPSEREKKTYYHGISDDPPELLYRSDYLENPFTLPEGRFHHIPAKTVHGVHNTPLKSVWRTVAPQICDILKSRKIRYSVLQTARLSTEGEDGGETFGPVVIWIVVHPGSTTVDDAHLASPEILALLAANGVHGAVVEWFEGAVERFSGPALINSTQAANPTDDIRWLLTTGLGMHIATADREGSVAFFFREVKDRYGNPSDRVLAVSNCHVLRKDTTSSYQFEGAGAPRQCVGLAGFRRLQRDLDDIKAAIVDRSGDADTLVREIIALEEILPQEARSAIDAEQALLAETEKDIAALENLV